MGNKANQIKASLTKLQVQCDSNCKQEIDFGNGENVFTL